MGNGKLGCIEQVRFTLCPNPYPNVPHLIEIDAMTHYTNWLFQCHISPPQPPEFKGGAIREYVSNSNPIGITPSLFAIPYSPFLIPHFQKLSIILLLRQQYSKPIASSKEAFSKFGLTFLTVYKSALVVPAQ